MLASDTPIVSIITLLSGRRKFLPLVRACVEAQTYPAEKIEWVIVDDGADDIGDFFSGSRELYLRSNKPLNIGRKRQFASDVASGEFLLFFDDDDLQFPHRIERCVKKLQKTGARMVAGNSEMFLANKATEGVVKVGPHHKNHATAATLAFRKEFLKHSAFRPSDTAGEEMHFLLNWTIPVIQMKCQDTIVALSHDQNTVSKDHLFLKNSIIEDLSAIYPYPGLLATMREIPG